MIPSVVPTTPEKITAVKADHHRNARAENQPGQHVAPELVGAEQVFGGAALQPERRLEPRRQGADLRGCAAPARWQKTATRANVAKNADRDDRNIAEPEPV
jgi:hypothetical protein